MCAFLDARLPQRDLITQEWSSRLRQPNWTGIEVQTDRRHLGHAFEVRLGLDLADTPGHWNLLSFLPLEQCDGLLRAAGFRPAEYDHLPDSQTSDPLLLAWERISRSEPDIAHPKQQAALAACLDATAMDQLSHKLGDETPVQTRRALFLHLHQMSVSGSTSSVEDPALRGLLELWNAYLRYGQEPVVRLGKRVVLAPELAAGFATADLVLGQTLVEIKTVLEPAAYLDQWLRQILGYVLLDRFNALWLDQIALYLGWQALLLPVSIEDLLSTATSGPTPGLETLREDFHEAIRPELDQVVGYLQRRRYPPPAQASSSRPL